METKGYSRLAGGGSSVLVIFLMLLLITLGALAMLSSNSNLRLAKKGAAWMKDYYLLEADGENIIELVSKSLQQNNEILSACNSAQKSSCSHFVRYLSCCLEDTGAVLPYGTEIKEWKVEPGDDGLVLLTALLARKHQSGSQCLMVQIQVSGASNGSTTGSFQILQWRQYQEPFEYEPEFNLLQ